jgi:hypothetical protein
MLHAAHQNDLAADVTPGSSLQRVVGVLSVIDKE